MDKWNKNVDNEMSKFQVKKLLTVSTVYHVHHRFLSFFLKDKIEKVHEAAPVIAQHFDAIFQLADQTKRQENTIMEAMQKQRSDSERIMNAMQQLETMMTGQCWCRPVSWRDPYGQASSEWLWG